KSSADGKEGPGDRSGEAHPCINASPATMDARHRPSQRGSRRVENHKDMAFRSCPGDAEPAATSFLLL
ncbi:hypothetical protein, partial [Salmonella enterica]|uniref:hypothetical protein n=1 Tax=Salmonella enterica TaxID=28901 RepID=UPI001C4E150F